MPDLAFHLTQANKFSEESFGQNQGNIFDKQNLLPKIATPRLVRWMDGRKGKLARERNGAIWREGGGGGADRFGRGREGAR